MKFRQRIGVLGIVMMEFLALNLSLLIVLLFSLKNTSLDYASPTFISDYFLWVLLFNVSWSIIIILNGNWETRFENNHQKQIKSLLINSLILVGTLYTIGEIFQLQSINQFNLLAPVFLFILFDLMLGGMWIRHHQRHKKQASNSRVLIIGGGENGKQLPDFVETVEHHGYQVVEMFNNNTQTHRKSWSSSSDLVEDLSSLLTDNPIDEIFIGLSSLSHEEIKRAVRAADYHGVRVNLIPEMPDFLDVEFKQSAFEDLPIFQLRQSPLDQFNNYILKRVFDFSFSLMALILLSPVYLLISICIYLDNRGPIFYSPIRKGKDDASFKCYKFRTMSVCDDPVNGQQSTVKDDPRLTRVGKFLRKYDLDELPQFFNVLQGDMSVVGPRPHRVNLQNDFRKIVNEYMVRHYIKPGVTGWAQVNGWRGPTSTSEQKIARIDHDLWYIESWSFWLDIKIIFLTVFGKNTRKNAF